MRLVFSLPPTISTLSAIVPHRLARVFGTVLLSATCLGSSGSAVWAQNEGRQRFVEMPRDMGSATYDLATVRMLQAGKFTVMVTTVDSPIVKQFKLAALDTLASYCSRDPGQYPVPKNLLSLGLPTSPVKDIDVAEPSTNDKLVTWPDPYNENEFFILLACHDNKPLEPLYKRQRADIFNGSRSKELFDCRNGLYGWGVKEDDDIELSRVTMEPVQADTAFEKEFSRMCSSVTGGLLYLPRQQSVSSAAPDPPALQFNNSRNEEGPAKLPTPPAAPVGQRVLVVDGDTLKVDGLRYRLWGIDAPETKQLCRDGWAAGRAATSYIRSLIQGHTVKCEDRGRDRYGRVIALCKADGRDIGADMVQAGMAWAFVRYSRDYVPLEREAQAAKLGVHARQCEPAWEWRAR